MSKVTPEDALNFDRPTRGFLCPISANKYGIDFTAFKIRDMESGRCVFEVAKDEDAPAPIYPPGFDYDLLRKIHYKFPADFLRYETVGTMLRFKVGDKPLKNFRMIERHYFNNKLMKSYDFNFAFCIPNTTNEVLFLSFPTLSLCARPHFFGGSQWEAIYDMPKLSEEEVKAMVDKPDGGHSDSFYFVDGKLPH